MKKKELIRAIKEEANRRAAKNPETEFVVLAKAAIDVVKALDIE